MESPSGERSKKPASGKYDSDIGLVKDRLSKDHEREPGPAHDPLDLGFGSCPR